jgi:hypothetical protein
MIDINKQKMLNGTILTCSNRAPDDHKGPIDFFPLYVGALGGKLGNSTIHF